MKPTLRLYIPGVMTIPRAENSWITRAVTHTIAYRKMFAESLEYMSFITFDTLLRNRRRAGLLKRRLGHYWREGWDIHLVGHSNAARIILRAIPELAPMPFKRVDLIAGAVEADCTLNNVNDILRSGQLESLHVWIGRKDVPLLIADWLGRPFGYGRRQLGRSGPINLDTTIPNVSERVVIHERSDLGHAGFLSSMEFERTFAMLLRE